MKHSTYVQIDKPLAEVWDYFRQVENMDKWLHGYCKTEHLSGEIGQPKSTYRQYYTGPAGKEIIFREEVLVVEDQKRFKTKMRNNMLEMTINTKFYPKGEFTEIWSEADVSFNNFAFRLMSSILMKEVTDRQDKNFKKLKAVLEAGVMES
ncbi:MAG: SRPBCC family protein [Bacteroidota bacterium]